MPVTGGYFVNVRGSHLNYAVKAENECDSLSRELRYTLSPYVPHETDLQVTSINLGDRTCMEATIKRRCTGETRMFTSAQKHGSEFSSVTLHVVDHCKQAPERHLQHLECMERDENANCLAFFGHFLLRAVNNAAFY